MHELAERWLRELEALGRSRHTLRAYRTDILAFIEWCAERGVTEVAELVAADLVGYLTERQEDGSSRATVGRSQTVLRLWLQWLAGQDIVIRLPELVSRPPDDRKLPRVLTLDEVQAMLTACDPTTWIGIRDRAILETLYSTGCRVSELVTLDRGDLDLRRGVARVLGKGRKERLVPLGRHAVQAVKNYLGRTHDEIQRGDRRAVFLSREGTRLSERQVQRIVKHAAKAARIEGGKDVHPHVLRHTFATHLLQAGAGLSHVQELLGHASAQTTQIYTHLVVDDLLAAFDAYHPRSM